MSRDLSQAASAFIALGNGSYQASELTRGPWNPVHQHAGPPCALAAEIILRAAVRPPKGEWICVDAQTSVGTMGCELAEARLFDEIGLIGRSTQTLLIRERG
jgi:hypothetical protein